MQDPTFRTTLSQTIVTILQDPEILRAVTEMVVKVSQQNEVSGATTALLQGSAMEVLVDEEVSLFILDLHSKLMFLFAWYCRSWKNLENLLVMSWVMIDCKKKAEMQFGNLCIMHCSLALLGTTNFNCYFSFLKASLTQVDGDRFDCIVNWSF